MNRREPYRTVRPALTADGIRAMTDDDLAALIRAGERYRPHVPPTARVDLDARLQIAREERRRRAALAREATPTHR